MRYEVNAVMSIWRTSQRLYLVLAALTAFPLNTSQPGGMFGRSSSTSVMQMYSRHDSTGCVCPSVCWVYLFAREVFRVNARQRGT